MAFTEKQVNLLTTAIDGMRDERATFEVSPLTIDNILHCFIKEEDHAVMQRAAELLQMKYHDRTINADFDTSKYAGVRINIRLTGTKPDGSPMFFVPRYATENGQVLSPIAGEVMGLLDDHLTAVIDNRLDFAYVRRTLQSLDALCTTPAHVAFFWPSIRIIAERATKVNEALASKLIDALNSPTKKSLPAIAPALRFACKETAEIITSAHILGRPSSAPDLRYQLSVYNASKHQRMTYLGVVSAN